MGEFPSYLFVLALVFLCVAAMPLLAARKGYKWYLWILGSSFLGLIVLAFLPFANDRSESLDKRLRLQGTGNIIGSLLTGISLGLGLFLALYLIAELPTSETTRVVKVVTEGLREKTGRIPDRVSLQHQGSGKYSGTASFGAETLNVDATVVVQWEAQRRAFRLK